MLAALLGVETLDGHQLDISASVGVADLRAGGDTDELLRRADPAMYRVKAGGGGRAQVAEPAPPPAPRLPHQSSGPTVSATESPAP